MDFEKLPAATLPDKRRAIRDRTHLTGCISFGGGAISTDCTVTQLSSMGARIKIPESVALPDTFDISIPQRQLNCSARSVWRMGSLIGIEFTSSEHEKPRIDEQQAIARIRELEAENAKLRARFAELTIQVQRLCSE
jgi:hypothetical protein